MSITPRYRYKNGLHQDKYEELKLLIPNEGRVKNYRQRVQLERLRKAVNIYYDLYNYNLVNYHASCFGILGLKYSQYTMVPDKNSNYCRFKPEFYDAVEVKLDELILKAYLENEYFKTVK